MMTVVMSWALLILRLVLGGIFLGHGAQKLFGAFGGPGLSGTRHFMEQLGLRPGMVWAALAGCVEFFGGALLVLGLLTPFGALLVMGAMLVAIARVHWMKGFWASAGGFEYNLALLAMALVPGLLGAGAFSLDAILGVMPLQPQVFLFGLALLVVLVAAIQTGTRITRHSGYSFRHRQYTQEASPM
jgi:putative oxidoreductase